MIYILDTNIIRKLLFHRLKKTGHEQLFNEYEAKYHLPQQQRGRRKRKAEPKEPVPAEKTADMKTDDQKPAGQKPAGEAKTETKPAGQKPAAKKNGKG